MNPQVPAPIPPWLRPVQSPMVQFITGDDTVDLGPDVTYLTQSTPKAGAVPWAVALPDGNFLRQSHRIFLPANYVANTAAFLVTGTFASSNSLLFNDQATCALLEWDGYGWQLMGGNAQPSSSN